MLRATPRWRETPEVTADLLVKYGFDYDRRQAYRDFLPLYARAGPPRRLTQEGPWQSADGSS